MTLDWNTAFWLAARQVRDTWIGYLISPIYFAFLGTVLATDDTALVNIVLPMMMMILLQATFSARYFTINADNEVRRHQMFLRSLPLSFGTITIARVIGMLAAGVLNVPVFFVWFWLLTDDFATMPVFLAWCLFWVGVAFCGLGLSLVQEFSLNLRTWTLQNTIIVVSIIVVTPLLIWLTNFRPVDWTVTQVHEHPVLMAFAGLVLGALGLMAGIRVAIRGFRRREFAA